MKKLLSILLVIFHFITLEGQHKINEFTLIDDVFKIKLSQEAFRARYQNHLSGDDHDVGIFQLENITFSGYDSESMVIINQDLNLRLLVVMPDYKIIENTAKYHVAEQCHKHIISQIGVPDKEEIANLDDPIYKEFSANIKANSGTAYFWTKGDIQYISWWLKTDNEDCYILAASTGTYALTTNTPIQRRFFNSLELGKIINIDQVASALEVSYIHIEEKRISSGKSYHYWNNIYFGGIEWSFVEFKTVKDKFSEITFTETSLKDNQSIFDKLFDALKEKYGEPKLSDNSAFWMDESTSIVLDYIHAESKGGEMRYYVTLQYSDSALYEEAQNIIADEL